ncbi:hypothetical protein GOHSU_27_00790 [Gordonia hirsuta DSM 44140 = NBRC 16056]|uniref:Uncharacterized protein n=1 Tax=Gordonia hirsuta DSM 44140 = NBRC 16056 TaxID=1121927 RepID=L7LD21_9ACTN|nr:hypothetical protein [Gordonia hirsuta]GAC57943.1 hypothetical protein GOHSU_27_00790 [Gordonia hirsuta DSM 44140 = NBRC 16056]
MTRQQPAGGRFAAAAGVLAAVVAASLLALVLVVVPFLFLGGIVLIALIVVRLDRGGEASNGRGWVMVAVLMILTVGSGLGMVNTLLLTPAPLTQVEQVHRSGAAAACGQTVTECDRRPVGDGACR